MTTSIAEPVKPPRRTGWYSYSQWVTRIASGVILGGVVSCLILAAMRSQALTNVRVTALNPQAEPRDPQLPGLGGESALPDYELSLLLTNGSRVALGSHPNQSAANGLEWKLSESVATADIASIRLREEDAAFSDSVAEVRLDGNAVTENGFRFDFSRERSFRVGVESFFGTPLGIAILVGFALATLLIVAAWWV